VRRTCSGVHSLVRRGESRVGTLAACPVERVGDFSLGPSRRSSRDEPRAGSDQRLGPEQRRPAVVRPSGSRFFRSPWRIRPVRAADLNYAHRSPRNADFPRSRERRCAAPRRTAEPSRRAGLRAPARRCGIAEREPAARKQPVARRPRVAAVRASRSVRGLPRPMTFAERQPLAVRGLGTAVSIGRYCPRLFCRARAWSKVSRLRHAAAEVG